jgi:PHD/YefM family antitoxin component YafN of YafNO toxin-antitoxin module
MKYISASDARKNIFNLIDEVTINHEPKLIKGKRSYAVLISNEDWEDIQETLLVMQNKELYSSLLKASLEPIGECATMLDW